MNMKQVLAGTVLVWSAYALPARAAAILSFDQVGGDVVGTLSGSLDITGLTPTGPAVNGAEAVVPAFAQVLIGLNAMTFYEAEITGPASWGPGSTTFATNSSGDSFGLAGASRSLFLPSGYVNNSSLSSTILFSNNSLAGIGFTLGDYAYTLPSRDTLTVHVGDVPVPEPASMLLLGSGVGAAILRFRRRKA